MIALSDIPEMNQEYENGDLLWSAAYPSLLLLLGEHEVEEVMEALSPELAARFGAKLHEEFSDEYWAEQGLWIDNAGGEPPNRSQIVTRVRGWLRVASTSMQK
jgi:hypothetical protein